MKKLILVAAAALLTLSASAQKFAHVNSQELILLMPEADQARATMAASQKEANDTYQSMIDEFNSKLSQYQANEKTWTAAIKESKEKELTEIQQRIQEFQQNIQTELSQQQNTLMAPIQQKASEAVNRLAREGGYIYVFDITSLIYIDPSQSTDLTPAARKALGIPDGRTLETLQQELQAQAQAQGR